MRTSIGIVLLALALQAQAARVIKVGNNQEFLITSIENGWRVNDTVCLFEGNREIACGIIAQKTSDKMGIKLTTVQGGMRAGQFLAIRRDGRVPASTQAVSEETLPTNPHNIVDIGAGLNAGFNYYYPWAHIQFALNDALSLGVMPLYFNSSELAGKIDGVGGFVTLNYYYTHFPFRGFFFQGAAGMYSMNVQYNGGAEKQNPFAVAASAQWRGKAYWGIPFDIGVGIGGQYLFKPSNSTVEIGFSGLLPLFTAYLGFSL